MRKEINYITIDGRGEHESFRDCITKAIQELKPNEGIHIIKDFEPFPMYKMMEDKGFDKQVEKISDDEFHVYFWPKVEGDKIGIGENLKFDEEKIQKIMNIEVDYLKGNLSLKEAKKKVQNSFKEVTAQEFAVCEQYIEEKGISNDLLLEKMEELLEIFDGILVSNKLDLPVGHPIRTYLDEVRAIRAVLNKMRSMLKNKFIKNQWEELYEKLEQINIHFSRKQNQLFAALESKGFDKPSKIMWTLDNEIRDIIKKAKGYLKEDKDEEFLRLQEEVIERVEDMMVKEEEILFPTSMDLLSEEDFVKMREGDDEIGYCLIETPPPYGNRKEKNTANFQKDELLKDLSKVLEKHGLFTAHSNEAELEVSEGKLTLDQINLIFKHLNVDISFVDENEIVKFYNDVSHRVFPRSPGVIGRKVQNCHPRESVDTVQEIVRAFREGEHDEAEFWLELDGKFVYILYNAVRDSEGNFRGVLEMVQDATKIRGLTGSQRLLSWNNKKSESKKENKDTIENIYGITEETTLGELVNKYPFIKEFLVNLSPKFSKLKNPVIFKTMSSIATLEMISGRGGFEVQELIDKIVKEIQSRNM
ncbi:PAS domain-containing protein [Clostridium sp. A1-XYC3]|uniref:PAS domain-containing protein n=1 Tax=Clostridium tanneri TaxID=3037988 RepID=A0ABU4JTN0_9CLOT|nr:PAS domain-containing protein [Clostridium sp. A1-XYC3]MDW8801519.1 PAS domain-containing protein [Clostridium sp. A1-XYC3]